MSGDDWFGRTVIEDDPNDPDMVIVYLGYGTQNQVAVRQERASLLLVEPPALESFVHVTDADLP